MTWRYRVQKSPFYFSEREIDFTNDYIDYEHFLLQEFFTADLETANKVSQHYYELYGSRSLAYIERQKNGWSKGTYHLTGLMRSRITSIMSQFLSKEAKHKLGIHEFINSIKRTVNSFQTNQSATYGKRTILNDPQEVVSIFESEFEKIKALTLTNSRFNILTDEEKVEALEISKYILETKLQNAFNQIERDFRIFLPYMVKFGSKYFSAFYSIKLFNLEVDIANASIENVDIPRFFIKDIEANSRFKEYSDKYLAYELLTIHHEAKKAIGDSFLNSNDIELFIAHYDDLLNGKSEVDMNSLFQGEGGFLSLKLKIKPMKLVKSLIIRSLIKLVIYLLVVTILIRLAVNHKPFPLFIFGGFFVGIFALSLVGEEIKQLKLLTKELRSHGK